MESVSQCAPPVDGILSLIYEGTATATGEEFVRALVRATARAMRVRWAFVSEFAGSRRRVRTIAFWDGNDFADNFEYDLDGTVCEGVLQGELKYYPEQVAPHLDLVLVSGFCLLAQQLVQVCAQHVAHKPVQPAKVEIAAVFDGSDERQHLGRAGLACRESTCHTVTSSLVFGLLDGKLDHPAHLVDQFGLRHLGWPHAIQAHAKGQPDLGPVDQPGTGLAVEFDFDFVHPIVAQVVQSLHVRQISARGHC